MKKKAVSMAIAALALFAMLTMVVAARGPTNVCGAPYNPNAWWHSGQYIGPEMFGVGTPTTIVLDDVTIYVGAIPMAVQDPQTGEWSGTHLMWKANYGHVWPDDFRSSYKFWLNGSGPVQITYQYAGGSTVVDYATEFIFFKTHYDSGWVIELQTYH